MMKNINIAMPAQTWAAAVESREDHRYIYNVAPAGGVNASISDMANWMIAPVRKSP
jgi:hypothetical protein